eukprot:669325_1
MQLGSLSLDSTSFISTANCIKALATLWFITVYGSYHCIVQGMFLFLYFQVECIAHRFMTPYNIYTCFQCLSNSHQSPTIEAARITNVSRNSRSNGSRSYPRRCDIIQRNDIVTRSFSIIHAVDQCILDQCIVYIIPAITIHSSISSSLRH